MGDHESAPSRTIVGYDGSARGWRVLAWAAEEAAAHSVPLLIVHCWQPRRAGNSPGGERVAARPLSRVTASLLADAVDRIRAAHPGLEVDGRLIKRSPVTALLAVARPGDLITVGAGSTSERGDPGSTASRLLARAPCDVVVLPGDGQHPDGPFPGHVVAVIDDSGTTTSVLARAFAEAEARKLPVAIVRAVHDTMPAAEVRSSKAAGLVLVSEADPGNEQAEDAAQPWQQTHPGLTVHRALFRGQTRERAKRLSGAAAMLVVGRDYGHGPTQLADLLLGEADCPVAIPAPCLVPYQTSVSLPQHIPAARAASQHS